MIKVTSGFLAIVILAATAFADATISSTFAAPPVVRPYPSFRIIPPFYIIPHPKGPPGFENPKWYSGWMPFYSARRGNPSWK
jgi:hypothetical protein